MDLQVNRSIGRVSLDIVDQGAYEPGKLAEPTGVIVAHTPGNVDSNQVENPPSRLSLILATPIRGCDLLHIVFVLVFGTWRAAQSGHDGLVVLTRVQLILMMTWSLVLQCAMMLERRPEICPAFFEVNLAPPIWRFIYRSEVYLFLLSLPPLLLAVALLRSALDVRRRAEPGNPLPGSHTLTRIALIAAIVVLIFALITTLQQLTKVARLRALHRFLVKDSVSLGLLGAWALSDCYVFFDTMVSINHLSGEDRNTAKEYLVCHTTAIVPFVLLLSQVEGSIIGPRWFQVLKGFLLVVLLFEWALCENFRNPCYLLFVCGVMIFFLHRFLADHCKISRAESKEWV